MLAAPMQAGGFDYNVTYSANNNPKDPSKRLSDPQQAPADVRLHRDSAVFFSCTHRLQRPHSCS